MGGYLSGLSNAIRYDSYIKIGEERIQMPQKYIRIGEVSARKKNITIPLENGKIELFPPEGETFKDAEFGIIPYLEGNATYGGNNYTYRILRYADYLKENKAPSQAPSQASSEAIPPLRFTPMSAIVATRFPKTKPRRRRRQPRQEPPPRTRTYIIVLEKP